MLSQKIKNGESVKPGSLLPVCKYINANNLARQFVLFLMECNVEEIRQQENIFVSQYGIDVYDLLLKSAMLCEKYINLPSRSNRYKKELKEMSIMFLSLQPGWKRVWVHATRRKAKSRNLLIAELGLKCLVDNNEEVRVYDLVVLYVYDYINYRFRMREVSISRVENIIEYLKL